MRLRILHCSTPQYHNAVSGFPNVWAMSRMFQTLNTWTVMEALENHMKTTGQTLPKYENKDNIIGMLKAQTLSFTR